MDKLGNNKNYSNKTFEDIRHIDKNGNEYVSSKPDGSMNNNLG